MALDPSFASVVRDPDFAVLSAANTNRDGTGTVVVACTGAASGTKINEVVATATGTTTAGMIRLFLTVDGGTTWRLFDEIAVTAITPSGTVAAYRARRTYDNLILKGTNDRLGVTTHNAEGFHVVTLAGDL